MGANDMNLEKLSFRELQKAVMVDCPSDYYLARAMWDAGIRPVWLNVLAARTQRISKGRAE